MTDLELLMQTFDKIGVEYVWHDDSVDDCNCKSAGIHLNGGDVIFWFRSGRFDNLAVYD